MASNKVKAIPDGYSTVQVHLVQTDSAKAIEFYKKAFGAEELYRMPGPGNMVMHAEVRIGNSVVMMADENLEMNPMAKAPEHAKAFTAGIMIYSEDVEKLWKRAVDAGAKVEMPLADQFWGDRYGQLSDPWGHRWSLAQHIEDVSPEDMQKRMAAMMSQKK
ncbi:MAG: VOC family protein [Myxococcota bacterium]